MEVDKSKSSGDTSSIGSKLARVNVSKGTEDIVKIGVINSRVKILDKDVSNSRFSDARISSGPHNSAWSTIQQITIQTGKSLVSAFSVMEVNISIS
jgi:hypothetical protein